MTAANGLPGARPGARDHARRDATTPAIDLRERLRDPRPVLLDGATGSELHRRGVDTRLPLWSAAALWTAPEALLALHREYVAAGAEIVTANTFRTRRRTLARAGRSERQSDLVRRAVELARAAAPRFVAGSLAPLEDCYSPQLVPGDAELEDEHSELARDLAAAGVDVMLVETMNTIREATIAARAARDVAATVRGREVATPRGREAAVIVSFVCGSDGRLLSGERVVDAVAALLPLGIDALAINCTPTTTLHAALQELVAAVAGRVVCGAYGNIGITDDIQGFTCTEDLDAKEYAAKAIGWVNQGARLVGGCCGTGPEHIAALRRALDARSDPPR